MEGSVVYRLMKPGEEALVYELILRVFQEFVAPEYSQEGVQEFLNYTTPALLLSRSQANHFVLIAIAQDKVVGMIEIRDNDHISLLFVDKQYHRRGIGRELLHRSLAICRKHKPQIAAITVNSSPYAVKIYEKLGFTQQGPKQVRNGIVFIPMALEVLAAARLNGPASVEAAGCSDGNDLRNNRKM